MFARHFGLRENPFPAGHQLRFLYPSREHQEARAHLRYGIENREPFVLITGEVGTGKTTALYDALAEWGAQVSVALITNSALTRQELLEEICLRFGVAIPGDATKPKMLSLLERHLTAVRSRGEHAVLLLDEAQNLAIELLEEIRLLSNVELQGEKLVQIFLVGQPELEAKLARPELRQLRQRITVHYRLNPLSPEETAGYIHHRLSVAGGNAWATFPPDSCREVYRVTHGIPREINTVAAQAMVTAFSENSPSVTVAHVRLAAEEGDFRSVLAGDDENLPSASDLAAALRAQAPVAPAPTPAPPPPPAAIAATPAAPAPVPTPSPISPHIDAPPAWTPEALEAPDEQVEPVLKEELDAWSAAAGELMKARQRQREAGPPEPPSRAAQAYARVDAAQESPVEPEPAPRPVAAEPAARGAAATAPDSLPPALPARLRDKLEQEIAAQENTKPGVLPWMIGLAVFAVLLVSAVLAQRFGAIDLPMLRGFAGERAAADSARATAPVTTPPVVARDSVAAASHDTVAAVAASVPPPEAAAPRAVAPLPTTTATVVVTKPAPVTIYGIETGNFLDESRAGQESARLADLTGMPARVIPYDDGGTAMYRVVVGNFGDKASAEKAADGVLSRPGVREARVVVLSRYTPRD